MVNGISVRKATVEDLIEWNSYAAAHNDASAYHHYAWIQAIKNAYKHENASVLARDTATNKLVGIFPAVELQIPLLGKSLCSLPYCDIGHGLAENQEIYDAMLSHIQRSISEEKKTKFEVRAADTKTTDSDLLKNKKVRMLLDLPSSSEALMASFKSKLRSQIKKAEKNGLTVSLGIEDHHILHFYDVYSKNMRDLGSPVHSIKWFREIVAAYQEQCLISVVYENDEPIGGGLIIKSGSEASIPWASTLRERNKLAPNMLLYWSLLAHCADNDVTRFDFGRSTFNEGTYKFKKQWGAKPQLLNWHTFNATSTVTSEKESNAGSPNKLRTIAEHIWRKLPLRITIAIGAAVRPYISLQGSEQMCGIAGFSLFENNTGYVEGGHKGARASLEAMHNAIYHRGPDAYGTYLDEHIGLCHRRLSILDLSEAGNQPMYSADEQQVIVFNGEIYNFLELRENLEAEGVTFKSHTDTEVILALYARDGVKCLQKLNGMFAFAIWDKTKQELFIARDRLGKKPLYYFSENGRFAFGSEIKAILALDNIPRDVRLDAVHDFFAYQYVPDPKSIFKHIHKLPPAHYMVLNENGFTITEYWDLSFNTQSTSSEEDNKAQLKALLEHVTKQRMISDVPLGAFLSGGVDSSGVVAMMAEASDTAVKTCTIGFENKAFNEADFAREIAEKYKTEHHEFTVHQNVADRLEHIVSFFDEPFADPSLVPTFFVSELARKAVTVALAGDGGDEMFAGYEKYSVDDVENRLRSKFPQVVRKSFFPSLAKLAGMVPGSIGKKAKSLLTSLSHDPAMGFYITNSMITDEMWQKLVKTDVSEKLAHYHPSQYTLDMYNKADGPDHLSKILYTDIKTYMTGDILVKVDRMSMANSLEVRAPILDYQVAEFAATIPSSQKYRNGEKKYLLKEVFKPFIPDSLLYRKKMGFSTPLDEWFRSELKAVAESTLIKSSKGLADVFNTSAIQQVWHEHQTEKKDHGIILWSMLMYQMWYDRYVNIQEPPSK